MATRRGGGPFKVKQLRGGDYRGSWVVYTRESGVEHRHGMYQTSAAAREHARSMNQRMRNPSKRKTRRRVAAALKKYLGSLKNPGKAKGRKVKGGRAVTLRNFSGTVTRKANGQVVIRGKGRK